jgi:hypothetical protein
MLVSLALPGTQKPILSPVAQGHGRDLLAARITDVVVKGLKAARVSAVDVLNGIEQELQWRQEGEDIVVPAFRVRDYPRFLRITPATR